MNKFIKRMAVIFLAIVLLLSFAFSGYAATVTNNGKRHELCVELSSAAKSYYTGNYIYATLSSQSGTTLLNSLRKLMTDTHTHKTSYDDCKNLVSQTDSESNDGKVNLLYTSISVDRVEDFAGSGSIGWNREHVWPKSLGGFANSGAGADLHHVRPSDYNVNGKRGNLLYGNVDNGTKIYETMSGNSVFGGTQGSKYFEPVDNVKGDVARICLYVYARYGTEYSKCSTITNVFESVDVLLEWCELDPVDAWEMGRNDSVESIQGNRNVFIDYPEYAWLIYNKDIPNEMSTPSGMAKHNVTPEPAVPETDAPATEAPATEAPATEAPATDVPTTEAPKNESEQKATDAPTTVIGEGCGASITVTVVLTAGIIGAALMLKKKED